METIKKYWENWSIADYLLAILLLTFTLQNKLMPILMVLLGITLFFQRKEIKTLRSIIDVRSPFMWFVVFYLTHFLGLMNTTNMDFAMADVGMKASFLILPIVLLWVKSSISLKQVVDLLIGGLVLTCLVYYSYAIFRSIYNPEDNHWAYFTESYLSLTMHRSYFATYCAFGAILCLHRLFTTKKIVYAMLMGLLSLTVLLTFSKAGIIILGLLLVISLVYFSVKYYGWMKAVITALLMFIFIGIGIISSPTLKTRFSKMLEATTSVSTKNNPSVESSAARVIMWSTSIDLMAENVLIGVGTGDVSDALDERNFELGNTGVAEKSLNSHNQFLNSGVQLGLFGLIPLVLIFVTSYVQALRNSSFALSVLTTVFVLTMLFESFLETQAGIIPVAFLVLLLALKSKSSPIVEN